MIDALTEPFASGIGQRALVELVVLGAACGPLGVWVALYRQSYAAESIAHAALPGLVLAALAGAPLVFGAAGGLLLAAAAIGLAMRAARIGADLAVAVAVTTLFGAGVLLAVSPDVPARLEQLLFGDPLAISAADLATSAILAVAVLAALAALHRRLALACFDPVSATSLGAPPSRLAAVLVALVAATTMVAVEALGNLLVVALVVGPGAAALAAGTRLTTALWLAGGVAIAAGIAGLYVSYHLELAAGASIAAACVAAFLAALPLGLRRRVGPDRRGHSGGAGTLADEDSRS